MTAPQNPRVTQADRESAAANILARLIYEHGGEQAWMDSSTQSMRMGEQDYHWEVQAFARHREAAEAEAKAREAALREVLRQIAGNNWRDQSRARHVAREALAALTKEPGA